MNEVKELVEELRNKKSRDNRELLDRSADMIEKLAKELCEKSGCHHKCHDTKDCVVEDEALLLINENKSNNSDFKSNNFEVKSNEELFKQALVEGLNRHFDREIEEAKKIEQIEEMAKAIHEVENLEWLEDTLAEALYNAGYRKQSEVIDEFAEKLKEAPKKCGLPLLGLSTKEEIEEYFNGIMLQVRDAIDNIAKEMKGGEE